MSSRVSYSSLTAWSPFSISYGDGSVLEPGDWTVRLEMEDTGERIELSFWVEGD